MAKKKSITSIEYDLSDELEAIVGEGPMTRGQVVKLLWEYIRENELQNPKKKRQIVPDDDLSEVIGSKPIDMLDLGSKITKHLFRVD